MNKTKLTLIAFSIFLLIGALSVSATGGLAALELRALAREAAAEVREHRLENKLIWAQNVELRTQIKLKLIDIKENDVVLEESVKTQLSELKTQLQAKYTALSDTKGDIHALTDGIKALIEAKDWPTLKTTYDRILAIQETRYDLLTDINGLLTQINDLLP